MPEPGHETWRAAVVTLYPEMFPGPLGHSLAGRALAAETWALDTIQLRDFAEGRHRNVDDTPAGGGAGMVLRPDVLGRAVDHARERNPNAPVVAMTPRGPRVTQARVRALAAGPGVTLLCGRFEGFDERIFEGRGVEPLCLADIYDVVDCEGGCVPLDHVSLRVGGNDAFGCAGEHCRQLGQL